MTQKQTAGATTAAGAGRVVRTVAVGAGFTVLVVLLLLWLAGTFARKIDAREAPAAASAARPVTPDTPVAEVIILRTPVIESAVGTVRAVHETAIASKLLAKVVEVNVEAGKQVRAGDVLVRLDDADLRAQLRQADAVVSSAKAARDQAETDYNRIKPLYDQKIETKSAFDQATTALKTAEAEYERTQQARTQAQTVLDYATIRSPSDGRVVDKKVQAGDTASPGQVLLTLYDPAHMQLVASVRESLTLRLKVGQTIGVRLDALQRTCAGTVSEIVPEAESASRTFQVKVTGPCPPGIYSGMFGRLLIPLDEEEVLVIPKTAVRRVGQLDIVEVAEPAGDGLASQRGTGGAPASGEVLRRRVVQLGREFGDQSEILSGLRAGEKVALPKASG